MGIVSFHNRLDDTFCILPWYEHIRGHPECISHKILSPDQVLERNPLSLIRRSSKALYCSNSSPSSTGVVIENKYSSRLKEKQWENRYQASPSGLSIPASRKHFRPVCDPNLPIHGSSFLSPDMFSSQKHPPLTGLPLRSCSHPALSSLKAEDTAPAC